MLGQKCGLKEPPLWKICKKNEKKCQQLIKNKIVKRIPLIDLIEKTKSYP